jgi:hypothetical protein
LKVIKILLNNPNWRRLIEVNHDEDDDDADDDEEEKNRANENVVSVLMRKPKPSAMNMIRKENQQLVAMFDAKMWDMFKIILDNCKRGQHYDFSKLDPPCKSIYKHPLMLIARSGQETLLKHDTTQKLLNLKWRYIPRISYYSNLFIYFIFLVLFAFYAVQLSNVGQRERELADTSSVESNGRDKRQAVLNESLARALVEPNASSVLLSPLATAVNIEFRSSLTLPLIVFILFNLFKEVLEILFTEGLAFFVSMQNWLEVFTYVGALYALMSNDFSTKSSLSSICVLFSFIVFSFLIQKLRMFGLYVVAFRRTLQNSAKFFPIFLLLFIGFILSFRIRANYEVSYFNTTAVSIIRTLTMVVGELETSEMGLYENSLANYVLYFLFISLMCVIVLNLFVGIAVGEIKTVLDEAHIQQSSMRIIFVLKVQETIGQINVLKRPVCRRFFNMRYKAYDYGKENSLVKSKDKVFMFLRDKFASREPEIKLADPQKRLEDSLLELSRSTGDDFKSIRESLATQIGEVETKLSNSQQRLEDCLNEMSRKTLTNFETNKEDNTQQMSVVEMRVSSAQKQMQESVREMNAKTNEKLRSMKQSFSGKLEHVEARLKQPYAALELNVNKLSECTQHEFQSIAKTVLAITSALSELQLQVSQAVEKVARIDTVGELLDKLAVRLDEKIKADTDRDERAQAESLQLRQVIMDAVTGAGAEKNKKKENAEKEEQTMVKSSPDATDVDVESKTATGDGLDVSAADELIRKADDEAALSLKLDDEATAAAAVDESKAGLSQQSEDIDDTSSLMAILEADEDKDKEIEKADDVDVVDHDGAKRQIDDESVEKVDLEKKEPEMTTQADEQVKEQPEPSVDKAIQLKATPSEEEPKQDKVPKIEEEKDKDAESTITTAVATAATEQAKEETKKEADVQKEKLEEAPDVEPKEQAKPESIKHDDDASSKDQASASQIVGEKDAVAKADEKKVKEGEESGRRKRQSKKSGDSKSKDKDKAK